MLRGTRDFNSGKDLYKTNIYYDGFFLSKSNVYVEQSKNDFVVLTIDNRSEINGYCSSSPIHHIHQGEVITFSFDVLFPDIESFNASYFGCISTYNKDYIAWNGTREGFQNITLASAKLSNIKSNEWYRVAIPYTIQQSVVNDDNNFFVGITFTLSTYTGIVKIRKLSATRSTCDKWMPSPFDCQ